MCASLGGLPHRLDNGVIAGAAAVVARQRLPDLPRARSRLSGQQILSGQDHARSAEAALERVLLRESLLEVEGLAGARHAFDRLDPAAIALDGQHETAPHDRAVHAHRAGAADAVLAADVGAGQLEPIAEKINEALPRLHAPADRHAVHRQRYPDALVHVRRRSAPGSWRAARAPGGA